MFTQLRYEILDRSLKLDHFFKDQVRLGSVYSIATSKGLAFVQMYAMYEFTLHGVVEASIDAVCQLGLTLGELRRELTALFLGNEFTSIRDCGAERRWKLQTLVMIKASSTTSAASCGSKVFPSDGSHYRRSQLQSIWEIFGVTCSIVPSGRMYPLIDELVENRNAIAHGRRTPDDVGRGYSETDIDKKIQETRNLCVHIVDSLAIHCSRKENVTCSMP